MKLVHRAAESEVSTILMEGEGGTGKTFPPIYPSFPHSIAFDSDAITWAFLLARSVFGLLVGFLARAAFLAGLAFLVGVRFVFGCGTAAAGMFDYTYGHSLGLILVGFIDLAPLVSGEKPQAAGVRSNTLALLDRAAGALLLVGSLPVLIPAALITRILSR